MNFRFATENDAPALRDIYGQYIATSITFETELPTVEEFAGRIQDIRREWPYLIWEEDGRAAGYAYAHHARERAAYNWYVELSIYLDRSRTGRGAGARLYALLLDMLRLQGVKTAMGCVTAPNPASEALHRAMGFRLTGTSLNAGYKNGAWHDVLWFEKAIGLYDIPPAPVVPIGAVPRRALEAVMGKHTG